MSTAYTALMAPAANAAAVTPHDTNPQPGKALYVGTGGDVAVQTEVGDDVIFPDVPSGFVLPVRFRRVLATGTAATGLVRLFEV